MQDVLTRMIFQAGVDFESVRFLKILGVHNSETFLQDKTNVGAIPS